MKRTLFILYTEKITLGRKLVNVFNTKKPLADFLMLLDRRKIIHKRNCVDARIAGGLFSVSHPLTYV